jgi:hypothetical protein
MLLSDEHSCTCYSEGHVSIAKIFSLRNARAIINKLSRTL